MFELWQKLFQMKTLNEKFFGFYDVRTLTKQYETRYCMVWHLKHAQETLINNQIIYDDIFTTNVT